MRIIVLARNYQSFLDWCYRTGIARDSARYAASEHDLKGPRFEYAIKTQSADDNPNYTARFYEVLRGCCAYIRFATV
jgi:hypothetical protein